MPIFEIEHDGKTYEVDAADMAAATQAFAPAAEAPSTDQSGLDTAFGTYDPKRDTSLAGRAKDLKTGLQALGEAAGGAVSGLGATAYGAIHGYVTNPIARAVGLSEDTRTPSEIKVADQARLTLQPSTPESAALQETIGKPYNLARQAVVGLGNLASPDVGAAAGDVLDVAPLALGARSAITRTSGALAPKGAPSPVQAVPEAFTGYRPTTSSQQSTAAAVQEAHDAGFKITPQQAGVEPGTSLVGYADPGKLGRKLSIDNDKTITKLAAEEVGLDPARPITRAGLERASKAPNAAYQALADSGTVHVRQAFRDEVAAIPDNSGGVSFPNAKRSQVSALKTGALKDAAVWDAGDAVNRVRDLRSEGYKNMNAPNAPKQNALGEAQIKLATAIDNELERHAVQIGKPDLVANLRAARVKLAQIAVIKNSLYGEHVSASAIARQGKNGTLTGGLATIKNMYDNFPAAVQNLNKLGDTGAASWKDVALGGFGGIKGIALTAARPAIRAYARSDRYQRAQAARVTGRKLVKAGGLKNASARAALISYYAGQGLDENGNPISEAQ